MERQVALTDTLMSIAGGSCVSALMYTFRRMDIAEEEIRDAKAEYPLLAECIDKTFRYLCPTPPLLHVSDDVYRFHCREVIDRIIENDEIEKATKAEVLGMLSEASLKAPLTHTATLLYEQLFTLFFPAKAEELKIDTTKLDHFERREVDSLRATLMWSRWDRRNG